LTIRSPSERIVFREVGQDNHPAFDIEKLIQEIAAESIFIDSGGQAAHGNSFQISKSAELETLDVSRRGAVRVIAALHRFER
jgi:hypothetical protein